MSYTLAPNTFHRMPVHFGPTPGPRQIPAGRTIDRANNPKRLAVNVNYLTERAAIEAILPPGFKCPEDANPIITAEIQYLKEIDWLAGRGYNTLGVKVPALYRGKNGDVAGAFLAVLWENLADPILSGRDELGFNKIWCDIAEPIVHNGHYRFSGIWLGYQFFEMELWDLVQGPASTGGTSLASPPNSKGMMHYKYVPKTGHPGEADATYVTMTPVANPDYHFLERFDAKGSFKFRGARWEDMPTQYHVINGLAGLPLKEFRGASLVRSKGGKDFGDQVIVR